MPQGLHTAPCLGDRYPQTASPPYSAALAPTPSSLQQEVPYPYNPNGSIGNIAGVCNAQGNVFGLMPHPERYIHALQHPQRRYGQNGHGDGLLIFANAFDYAKTLQWYVRTGI